MTPYVPVLIVLDTVILDHAGVDPDVFSLDLKGGLRGLCLENKVIIAVRAVLVAVVRYHRQSPFVPVSPSTVAF